MGRARGSWSGRPSPSACSRRRRSTGGVTPTPAPDPESAGLGGAVKQVAEHVGAIARLELELASLELKRKATAIGVGVGLALGAGLFALYALGFLFATVASAFETFLADWLSLLITTAILFALAGLLGILARGVLRRGTPPVPRQAIEEAKLTAEALRR